ncbi:HIT domain-containing protein [Streptomyces avermitilis]|uniref:HIT family protein n=1 Tax=Streptomyces avermitilis TaxID=33903 RepID=UPI0033ACF391
MSDADWISALERGEDPNVLHRMRTGWAVLGSTQHLPGYCLLVHDSADHLTDLSRSERAEFLLDLSLLGEAIQEVCSAADPAFYRVNYEVLGNLWNHLHGHVHARYHWEPQERRQMPVWLYAEERLAEEHRLGPAHKDLRSALTKSLAAITSEAYQ